MPIRILKPMKWRATGVAPLLLGSVLELLCTAAAAQPASPAPATATNNSAAAQLLLLDGVRAFRAERYEEALAIFHRVEVSQPSGDIGFYLGMTQHKLERHLEALVMLRAARRRGMREPVADYYQAVSCYRLGMFERARQGFATLSAAGRGSADAPLLGPRLQQGAQRFAQAIGAASTTEIADKRQAQLTRYETALRRTDEQLASGSALAALEWFHEAVEILALIPQGVDRAEKLPSLRSSFLRLREGLREKPAEADLTALWLRVSGGAT